MFLILSPNCKTHRLSLLCYTHDLQRRTTNKRTTCFCEGQHLVMTGTWNTRRRGQILEKERSTNSLSDLTIFHAYSRKYEKILQKLPRQTIINLALSWLGNPDTEPHLEWSNYNFEVDTETEELPNENAKKEKGLEILREEYSELLSFNTSKKEIVQRILLDHWTKGLNMIQIAEIDACCKYSDEIMAELMNRHFGDSEYTTMDLFNGISQHRWYA